MTVIPAEIGAFGVKACEVTGASNEKHPVRVPGKLSTTMLALCPRPVLASDLSKR